MANILLLSVCVVLLGVLYRAKGQCMDCEYDNATASCWSLFLESVPTCLPETTTSLDLWDNNITLTDDSFQTLTNLEEIYLDANGITELPRNVFRNLPNLTTVSLVENRLSSVPASLFSDNLKISFIDLTLNALENVDIIFSDLPQLQVFYATKNQVKEIGSDGTELVNGNLAILDLSFNFMTTLSRMIFNSSTNLEINLTDNPWLCDCDTFLLVKDLDSGGNVRVREWPDCVAPPELAGVSWYDLDIPC